MSDIDLDLWPEAKEAIQQSATRGFIMGAITASLLAWLAWVVFG